MKVWLVTHPRANHKNLAQSQMYEEWSLVRMDLIFINKINRGQRGVLFKLDYSEEHPNLLWGRELFTIEDF